MIHNIEREKLFSVVADKIIKTNTVLDIGCGIRPMDFFTPKTHILLEPFPEYVEMLRYKYSHLNHIIINENSVNFLPKLPSKSIDSIFLLDVIEHLDKEEGLLIIKEMERIAKKQIIIFTPLGFEEQDCESEEVDGWGLGGLSFQQHRSGWFPSDFSDEYDFYVCEDFHHVNWKNEEVTPFGCFFAIKNITDSDFKFNLPKNYKKALAIMPTLQDSQDIAYVPKEPPSTKSTMQRITREYHRIRKQCKTQYHRITNKIINDSSN